MTIVGARLAGRFDVRARVRELPGYVELRVLDREVDVEVAMWVMEPGLHGMVARDTLLAEEPRLRAVVHPALRRLFAIGMDGESLWATYALADGGPLPQVGRSLPIEQVVAWVRPVAEALDMAHQYGFSHGRLVPAEVGLQGGRLVLGGVGLWHDVEHDAAATAWRSLEQFIAPEVREGAPPTPAADAWSLATCAAALYLGAPDGGRDPERAVAERHPALARALAGGLVREPERRVPVRDLALRIADAARQGGAKPAPPAGARSAPPAGVHAAVPRAGGQSTLLAATPPTGLPTVPAVVKRSSPSAETAPPPMGAPSAPPANAPPTSYATPAGSVPAPRLSAQHPASQPRPSAQPPAAPMPHAPSGPHAPPRPPTEPPIDPMTVTPDPNAFSADQVTGALTRAKTAAPGTQGGAIQAVSMRPAGAPRPPSEPPPDPLETTEARRAKIRPIAEASQRQFSVKPGALGYMAPPKDVADERSAKRKHVIIAAVAGAVVLAGGIVIAVVASGGDDARAGGAAPDGGAGAIAPPALDAPPAPARACTPEMIVVGDVCIDAYEAPGAGRLPDTGVSFTEAHEACKARGLRLCGAAEWRAACAGPEGAPWPYGAVSERGVCNVGSRSAIAATGSFERCKSAAGAFDLAGNVAEWLADGTIAGGSALDGSDGRCDGPGRTAPAGARFADVGFRCCGDL